MKTVGSERLARKLRARGAMTRLAEQLGVHPSMVSRWARGERIPQMDTLAVLEKDLRIPMRAWTETPEEPAA